MKYIIEQSNDKDAIILDFFAGSGTTAHAVLELNKQDGGNRQFIMCTNNENNNGNGTEGIARGVCQPRIKKVIEGYSFKGQETKELYNKELKGKKDLKEINKYLQEAENIQQKNEKDFDKVSIKFEKGVLKVLGENNIQDKKPGLGGNLRYFKTNFVPADKTDENKEVLAQKMKDMLCVKEEAYEEVISKGDYVIFRNSEKYFGIIFDLMSIDDFKQDVEDIERNISVYVFSFDDDVYEEEFEDLTNVVSVSPIPDSIFGVYDKIFK